MPDLVNVTYAQTGSSTKLNKFGMREMQERAFALRDAQYLLIKSPPASGKSRALMYIALDKLHNQGLKKAIITVPERAIGSSFQKTDLKTNGFFANWEPSEKYNLCSSGGSDQGKVKAFKEFMESDEQILICTHATLRFACETLDENIFNQSVIVIDEFHHVSADRETNKLGSLLHSIMNNSPAHVVAMTGSYFRGDAVPILLPEDESKFTKVTYSYYEQLNGYTHLKSLGIGYAFYQGQYFKDGALASVLNTDKKTILHIPSVNSAESTKEKYIEVDRIIDIIGERESQDAETGVIYVKRHGDGKIIKVADLVNDEPTERNKIVNYLRGMDSPDDLDLIIALGMAKEGFDWPYCEHALTIGYRGSLTEVIQIIGRATRDSDGKQHAQFTNLIAQPNAEDQEITLSVNNMLKAITCSLLMEQVMAPNYNFTTRLLDDNSPNLPGEIKVKGLKKASAKVQQIIEDDLNDLKAAIMQDSNMLKAMPGNVDPEVMNKVLIPRVIIDKYPDLTEEEVEQLRQRVVLDSAMSSASIIEQDGKKFITMANRFVNIDELNIDLIDKINPFQRAFEILSKSVTASVLKLIQETIDANRIQMTDDEAVILWPKIQEFVKTQGRHPNINSLDPLEKRMAECIVYMKRLKREAGK